MRDKDYSAVLLGWYDRHARVMPWRVLPAERAAGALPDPYRIWLSEVMLQQTTVAAVHSYFLRFTARWPTVAALAAAEDGDVMGEWAGLGYYARARNLLKCARVVAVEHGGIFPSDYNALLKLPGIGPYTAAAIAAIAFDQPETVVDGNVERVMARLFDVHTPLPAAKPELTAIAARLTPARTGWRLRSGGDGSGCHDLHPKIACLRHLPLVRALFGARRRGYRPNCRASCPSKRSLPGMASPMLPGAATGLGCWSVGQIEDCWAGCWDGLDRTGARPRPRLPPVAADWQDPGAEVRHTFTHFHLRLSLRTAVVPLKTVPNKGIFLPNTNFRPSDLPTVMRKAYDLAAQNLAMD